MADDKKASHGYGTTEGYHIPDEDLLDPIRGDFVTVSPRATPQSSSPQRRPLLRRVQIWNGALAEGGRQLKGQTRMYRSPLFLRYLDVLPGSR
jgi:hypothetical protein